MDLFMEQFMDDLAERVAEKLARRQRNVLFPPPPPRPHYTSMHVYDNGCGSSSSPRYDGCGREVTYRSGC
jgi:hypothetical protein